jgi:hypothetical protein
VSALREVARLFRSNVIARKRSADHRLRERMSSTRSPPAHSSRRSASNFWASVNPRRRLATFRRSATSSSSRKLRNASSTRGNPARAVTASASPSANTKGSIRRRHVPSGITGARPDCADARPPPASGPPPPPR